MAKWSNIVNVLGHYKHLITIVVGVLFVGVLCDTSIVQLLKLDAQKNSLEEQVNGYKRQAAEAKKELEALGNSSAAVERVARERYRMKYWDEDIFVLSTDIDEEEEYDNTGGTE